MGSGHCRMQLGQASGNLRPAAARSGSPRPSARGAGLADLRAARLPALWANGPRGTLRWPDPLGGRPLLLSPCTCQPLLSRLAGIPPPRCHSQLPSMRCARMRSFPNQGSGLSGEGGRPAHRTLVSPPNESSDARHKEGIWVSTSRPAATSGSIALSPAGRLPAIPELHPARA